MRSADTPPMQLIMHNCFHCRELVDGRWRATGLTWNSDQGDKALSWCRRGDDRNGSFSCGPPRGIFLWTGRKVAHYQDGQYVFLDERFQVPV